MVWYQSSGYYRTKKSGKNDSKFEAGYAQKLELEKKAGKIVDYQEQIVIPLEVNGLIVADYKIDFVVQHNDGTTEYVETKGWFTDVWRLKWKIFLANFENQPNTKISLVCQGKGYKPKLRKIKK